MRSKNFNLRVFAEGVRIPAASISRTQAAGRGFQFSVIIPPRSRSFQVLPGTLIQAFLIEEEGGEEKNSLFAEGYVQQRQFMTDKHGRRSTVFLCTGYDDTWSKTKLGLDIGDGVSTSRHLLHQMFVGLSAGNGEGIEILPGQRANLGSQLVGFNQQQAQQNKFLNLQYFLTQFMLQYGPMSGIIHTMANLAGASPLFKQRYNAHRVVERIVYRENYKVAALAADDVILRTLFRHLGNFSSDASLMDVLRIVLQQTEHQYVFLPSPQFNKEALYDEGPDFGAAWQAVVDTTINADLGMGDTQSLTMVGGEGIAAQIVSFANQWKGVPYAFGGDSRSGIDCSAYVRRLVRAIGGPNIPRTTLGQHTLGQEVQRSALQPADLVFFKSGSGSLGSRRHVGVYIGNGRFTHSGSSTGPTIAELDNSYWNDRFWKCKRISYQEVAEGEAPSEEEYQPVSASDSYRPTEASETSGVRELLRDPRIRAFLDMIIAAETDREWLENPQRGIRAEPFRTMYNHQLFDDFSDHPREEARVGNSSPAGAFQFQITSWDSIKALLKRREDIELTSFRPAQQFLAAVATLRYKRVGAVRQILSGNIRGVIEGEVGQQEWVALKEVNVETLLAFYEARLQIRDATAPEEFLSENYRGLSDTDRGNRLAQQIGLVAASFEAHEPIEGALRQMVFMPRLRFAPPPTCNVFFPEQYTNLQVDEDFNQAPSRMMMLADPAGSYAFVHGGNMQGIVTAAHFSPRYIQGIFDVIRGNNPNATIPANTSQEGLYADLLADYLARVQALKAQGIDPEQAMTDPTFADAVYESMAADLGPDAKQEDVIREILRGERALPSTLLGLYTYDELFRGVIPVIGRFPYRTGTLGPPSADVEEADAQVADGIRKNAEVLQQTVKNTDEAASLSKQESSSEGEESVEDGVQLTIQSMDAPSVDPESARVNLFANYQFAISKKDPRRATFTTPLAINIACGFQGAVYDKSLGWVIGEIVSVSDTLDVAGKTGMSQVQMVGCRFMGDYDDPVWARIHAEADAEACRLAENGEPESPLIFDEEFSTTKVGDSVYQPILGVGSIVDWAKQHKRDGEPEPKTVVDSLTILERAYRSQGADSGARADWVRRFTERPIAQEKDVMGELLQARSDSFGYTGVYSAASVPEPSGTPFMAERRAWARRYASGLKTQNNALVAAPPTSS